MYNVVYSAPAKVILSGEHGVVYGKPALATAITLRLYAHIWEEGKPQPQISSLSGNLPSLRKKIPPEAVDHVIHIVQDYLKQKKHRINSASFAFDVVSEIPLGRGLGSSSALSVAAVAALSEWYTGEQFPHEVLNTLAYKVEKFFHTTPSGIDNSVSCYGGLVYYRKEFEFLKQIASLNFQIPQNIEDHLYLIDTGKPAESTSTMVQAVRKQYNANPEHMETLLHELEKCTKRMVIAITKEDSEFFIQQMEKNQGILEEFGIVSPSVKELIYELSSIGVGKVTGAGGAKKGSGFLLLYAPNPEKAEYHLTKRNLPFQKVVQDKQGVRRETVKI